MSAPHPDQAPEHPHTAHEILEDPEFQEFARKKNVISLVLTVVMMGVYFGFIGALAFAPEALARPMGAATIGIPFGIGVIVFAWIATGIYVSWANSSYDSQVEHLKNKIK